MNEEQAHPLDVTFGEVTQVAVTSVNGKGPANIWVYTSPPDRWFLYRQSVQTVDQAIEDASSLMGVLVMSGGLDIHQGGATIQRVIYYQNDLCKIRE